MEHTVVIFSLLSWESKLLHRAHMLAKYFHLKGHKVYYIQKENISGVKELAFQPKCYEDKGITIISLPALPYMKGRSKSIYDFNDWIMAKQLKDVFSKLSQPLILLESPYWIKAVNRSRDRKGILCYDISDDLIQFATNNKWKKILSVYEVETVEKADFIFITSEELRKKAEHKERVFLVENGIDLEEFKNARDVLGNDYDRPICGFIGGLFQWIDFDLIDKLAVHLPDYSFVLIGPTDQSEQIEKLCKKPNIYYLGEKDKSVIGDYFAGLDMGLIPFVSEEQYPRLKTVNSNKVFQYCYFGYPVVSSKFEQVNGLQDIIKVCDGYEEWISALERIKISDSPGQRERRRKFAYDNSWAKRVDHILDIVYNYKKS